MKTRKDNSTFSISAKVSKDMLDYIDKLCRYSERSRSEIIKDAIQGISIQNIAEIKTKHRLSELYLLNKIVIKLEEISSHCQSNNAVDESVLIQLKKIEDILLTKNFNDM